MNGAHNTSQPADLELAQCYIRLFVPLPILILWYLFWSVRTHSPEAHVGLVGTGVFCAFTLAHWANVKRNPGYYPLRRIVAIVVDQTGCFCAMLLTGELGAIVAFLSLWISLGNGIRFGVKWMALSASLASLSLMTLGLFSDYWSRHPIWIVSLVLLNTAIPAYVASLIRGFHDSRIKLSQYADEMEKMALKDALTGLPNRSAYIDELDKSSAYAQRTASAIAVLYFDLDGFKRVNDTLGHALGDMLLKETAKRVNDVLRGEDALARLGGDEFAVLLKVMDDGKRARGVADRIRQAIASIEGIDGHPIEVTASVGIVVVNGADAARMGAEQIIHEADKNMYAAKKDGKNQVVLTSLSTGISLVAKRA
jgi:diguanylate cyclase (GGDEF)-like protein